jgi:hypothetical protein
MRRLLQLLLPQAPRHGEPQALQHRRGARVACGHRKTADAPTKMAGANGRFHGFYMVLYGFIWFYMVLYGFIWFYMVL